MGKQGRRGQNRRLGLRIPARFREETQFYLLLGGGVTESERKTTPTHLRTAPSARREGLRTKDVLLKLDCDGSVKVLFGGTDVYVAQNRTRT